jgi:hypothetical protein
MHIKLLLILLTVAASCFSQDTIPISGIDTPINFFRQKPLRLHPYNNRVVPFDNINPLYVQINYEDGKNKNFEYFRIDSLKYLVYEFFRSSKGSSNEGLKSRGIMKVTNDIAGISTTTVNHIGRQENKYTKRIHHYRALSKEGEWEEFEDSVFNHRYWTGNYLNNKKVGIWSNYIYDPNDDRLIQQIDYDKDSSKRIFSTNIVGQLSIDSINYYLLGRWPIGYDPSDDERNLMMKCQLYDGSYGDDCNSRFGKISYYEFLKNGKFNGQNGETNKKKTIPKSGFWKVSKLNGKAILEISSADTKRIRYDIIYLDREGNMVADRK